MITYSFHNYKWNWGISNVVVVVIVVVVVYCHNTFKTPAKCVPNMY